MTYQYSVPRAGMLLRTSLLFAVGILAAPVLAAGPADDLRTVHIQSSKDGARQGARIYVPPLAASRPVPLLVVLHSWSGNFQQKTFIESCLKECQQRQWALVHPDFRGPNRRPDACASELAVQDVLDAVHFMRHRGKIDRARIYLVGTSGGGHMAMFMAGRAPEIWAGVSSWVGISDLAEWHRQCKKAGRHYTADLEACCGGPPGASDQVDAQYRARSPQTFLHRAEGLPIDLNAGIHDGHTGSVPISQSLHAFNVLAEASGQPDKRLSAEQIAEMTTLRRIPAALRSDAAGVGKRRHPILFRRQAGSARVTIFEGGHEGDMPAAIRWLSDQRKEHPPEEAQSRKAAR